MSHDAVLLGLGLIVSLGTACQLAAERLRLPALILLLPVGFIAGLLTQDINPVRLLGGLFEPVVSLAVAVILFSGGRGLNLRRLSHPEATVVRRLLFIGVPLTWLIAGAGAALLVGMSPRAAILTGAILVVSGPTVVEPLLSFVQPERRVRTVLNWEGTLIDPVGALLGVLVFHAVMAPLNLGGLASDALRFPLSLLIGGAGAAVGAAAMYAILRWGGLSQITETLAIFGVLILVVSVCDALQDETGLIAAVLMGMALVNIPGIDVTPREPFLDTLVHLVIGVLFIAIPATISAGDLLDVLPESLALVALLVLVQRPLVALLATRGVGMSWQQRAFIGWMDPRGIVAAASVTVLAPQLVAAGVPGAQHMVSVTFLVIVGTVVLYGLTALPVARRLRVGGVPHARPLLIGGAPWVADLAEALARTGARPLLWTSLPAERDALRARGLDALSGDVLEEVLGPRGRMDEVTGVYLLTEQDDFNAVADLTVARDVRERIHRLAPSRTDRGVIAPFLTGEVLFGPGLTGPVIGERMAAGGRIDLVPGGGAPAGDVLFVHRASGALEAVTTAVRPAPRPGDVEVVLLPGPVGAVGARHAGAAEGGERRGAAGSAH